MNSKTIRRYTGAAILLGAILLPLGSQADVIWSISFGPGLHYDRDYHHRDRDDRRYHHRRQIVNQYYWRHRHARGYYDSVEYYRHVPRHRIYHHRNYYQRNY